MFRKVMISATPKNIEVDVEETESDKIVDNKTYDLKLQLPLNPKADIYGSMEAEIIDFAIINAENKITNHIRHDERYTILMTTKFHQDITDPIFAYTFKSVDGMEITGTNTNNLNMAFGKITKGEIVTVRFTQKMILNSGAYFLALGCVKYNDDGLKAFHRIYDAVNVEITSLVLATGLAFAPCKIETNRQDV